MDLIDYHVHTNYSIDSKAPLESVINMAVQKGLKEICITDHVDNPNLDYFDMPDYNNFFKELEICREKYKTIKILFGAEISLAPYLKKQVDEVINTYDYDFIIGSSHEIDRQFLYSQTTFFDNKTKEKAFQEYFEEILVNVKTFEGYNVYGHLDYVFRYSRYYDNSFDYFSYKEIIDEILKELIYRGKGIELNASGFYYKLNVFHPCLDILKTYKDLGGEILTFGSDSHSPEYICTHFNEAMDYIKSAGINYISTFEKKKLKQIPIL